jgi:hypothetical protein
MKLVAEYLERSVQFERMAAEAADPDLNNNYWNRRQPIEAGRKKGCITRQSATAGIKLSHVLPERLKAGRRFHLSERPSRLSCLI